MKLIVMTALALMLMACGGHTRLGGSPAVTVVNSNELPAPDETSSLSEGRRYLIGPYDKLTIDVFGIEDLSKKEIQTDASGRISFPLVGVIEAAGRTPGEVEQIIQDRLRGRYVKDPQVTVNLKETVSQVVTVDGEVKEPGLYPVVGRMTLVRAVATAKGTSEFAKLEDVVVFRTVKGQRLVALYNLKSIRTGAYADPEIYANDVVIVGNSSARQIFKDALSVIPLLTTPLIYALR